MLFTLHHMIYAWTLLFRQIHLALPIVWPSTPKFDIATWAFLKIDMRHGAL